MIATAPCCPTPPMLASSGSRAAVGLRADGPEVWETRKGSGRVGSRGGTYALRLTHDGVVLVDDLLLAARVPRRLLRRPSKRPALRARPGSPARPAPPRRTAHCSARSSRASIYRSTGGSPSAREGVSISRSGPRALAGLPTWRMESSRALGALGSAASARPAHWTAGDRNARSLGERSAAHPRSRGALASAGEPAIVKLAERARARAPFAMHRNAAPSVLGPLAKVFGARATGGKLSPRVPARSCWSEPTSGTSSSGASTLRSARGRRRARPRKSL